MGVAIPSVGTGYRGDEPRPSLRTRGLAEPLRRGLLADSEAARGAREVFVS